MSMHARWQPSWLRRRRRGSPGAAFRESIAIGMVGDGLVALLWPREHVSLWRFGPRWYQDMVDNTATRPGLVRLVALAMLLGGLWWVRRTHRQG